MKTQFNGILDEWGDDDGPTLELPAQQLPIPRNGRNTNVMLFHNVALKSSQRPFDTLGGAKAFLQQIEVYHRELDREGAIALAPLEMAEPILSGGKFYVMNAVKTVLGPNLMDLRGPELRAAVGEIIWSIRLMEPYQADPSQQPSPNKLKRGFDSTGGNFIVSPNVPPVHDYSLVRDRQGRMLSRAGTPVGIDYDPPYLRGRDSEFLLGMADGDRAFRNRAYGTRTGAIANLLLTGLYMAEHPNGADPQSWQAFYNEWRELVPADMHDQVAQDIDWLINWRP